MPQAGAGEIKFLVLCVLMTQGQEENLIPLGYYAFWGNKKQIPLANM